MGILIVGIMGIMIFFVACHWLINFLTKPAPPVTNPDWIKPIKIAAHDIGLADVKNVRWGGYCPTQPNLYSFRFSAKAVATGMHLTANACQDGLTGIWSVNLGKGR